MSGPPRTVKLWCPSVSKMAEFVARDEQRLDLGSIARVFGLDPSTVRLNGHFISRGADLVSPSVTWRSLLNFFSARGLSTGQDDRDALLVHGKLCPVGTKRAHEPEERVILIRNRTESEGGGLDGRRLCQDTNLRANKKLKESESGGFEEVSIWNGVGSKRKEVLEAVQLPKKLKENDAVLDCEGQGKGSDQISSVAGRQFNCNYTGANLKRASEDDAILAVPCKRIK